MNNAVQKVIHLSAGTLRPRSPEAAAEWKAANLQRLPGVPDAVMDFFSTVEMGSILEHGHNEEGDEEVWGYDVDELALQRSVSEELELQRDDNPRGSYFDYCYTLFLARYDPDHRWCLDLNPGPGFGQIMAYEVYFGEHPAENSKIWAPSFEDWLELVIGDHLALQESSEEHSRRLIDRLPTLRPLIIPDPA